MKLSLLIFGDIFGKPGRIALQKCLPALKAETGADVVVANVENLAHGMGITEVSLRECMDAGVTAFTGGNDMWSKPEALSILPNKTFPVVRPANYPPGTPGRSSLIIEVGSKKILLINLIGRVFMPLHADCPFRTVDAVLKEHASHKFSAVLVDVHAEATSEKVALGHYLDGRASLVYGTHTHVPTADMRVLAGGTGYCTDVGFTGPKDSVIGVRKDIILEKFLTQRPKAHQIADSGVAELHCLHVVVDTDSGKTVSVARLLREVEF